MTNLIKSIIIGMGMFPIFALLLTVPIVLITILTYRKLNFMRIALNYAMLLYLLCVASLVLLPLPDAQQAKELCSHDIQWIPFHFIADIIKDSPFELSSPSTYLPSLFSMAIWQVIFNICMFVPFGMYMRYYRRVNVKKVIIAAALFSAFIELTQLTGIFGIYHGSYRFCDIDDLMTNTLGGYLGYRLMEKFERRIPAIHTFDVQMIRTRAAYH